jgi:hypothetical protein
VKTDTGFPTLEKYFLRLHAMSAQVALKPTLQYVFIELTYKRQTQEAANV